MSRSEITNAAGGKRGFFEAEFGAPDYLSNLISNDLVCCVGESPKRGRMKIYSVNIWLNPIDN
jgi:hypothetical protein